MTQENMNLKPSATEATPVEYTRDGTCYRPDVDILEQENELLVVADVPGAKPDAIDVQFEDGELTIHARIDQRQDKSQEYLLREYGVGDYYRTFRISEAIDSEQITADCAEGVLTLHLPKAEAARPRRIAVRAN